MFKSLKWIGSNPDANPITKRYEYTYRIVDENFEENIIFGNYMIYEMFVPFIKVYENKNLNVSVNIALLMQYNSQHNRMPQWSVENQIKNNLKHNKYYIKHHNDVEKYLLLL